MAPTSTISTTMTGAESEPHTVTTTTVSPSSSANTTRTTPFGSTRTSFPDSSRRPSARPLACDGVRECPLTNFGLVEVLEVDQQFERHPTLPGLDLELLMVCVDRMSRAFDGLM